MNNIILTANGTQKADLVLKNASIVNVFTESIEVGDVAITDGKIVGIGLYEGKIEKDMTGRFVCPGFIDGHIHLESSMVTPSEFARAPWSLQRNLLRPSSPMEPPLSLPIHTRLPMLPAVTVLPI